MDYKVFSTELAGRPLSIEFGKYAQQANGSAFVRYGDTVVMVNATMSEKAREGVDFFPLSVDFEEKQYSVGKIPGGYLKREGRPPEKYILTSLMRLSGAAGSCFCDTLLRCWRSACCLGICWVLGLC